MIRFLYWKKSDTTPTHRMDTPGFLKPYTQGSLAAGYRHIVDTKPCNVSVRRQTECIHRKTEKKAESNWKPSSDLNH